MEKTIHIISRGSEIFDDRIQAGQLLAEHLVDYRGSDAVVLGIPRGGVIIANEIAEALDADLDVCFSRKLGAPGHEEFAVGAVSEDGGLFLNQRAIRQLDIASEYILGEKDRQLQEIARRTRLIRGVRPKVSLAGRTVIITDDGIATGATMQAALWAIRHEAPRQVIAALPVGVEATLEGLRNDADEVICLQVPAFFSAVGQFYRSFEQITDDEVIAILQQHAKQRRESPGTR